MEGRRRREGLVRTMLDGGLKDEAIYLVERFWKEAVEEKIAAALRPTGLIPHVPHDMRRSSAREEDLRRPGAGERGDGVAGGRGGGDAEGYSGVAIIAPFGCLRAA